MSDKKHVGDVGVECPECQDVITVPVYAEIVTANRGAQNIITEPDLTHLWAHYEAHLFGKPVLTDTELLQRAENRITRALSILEAQPGYAQSAFWPAVEILRGEGLHE